MKKLFSYLITFLLAFYSNSSKAVETGTLIFGAASGAMSVYMFNSIKNSEQAKEQGKMCGPQNAMSCIIAGLAAANAVMMIAQAFESEKTKNSSNCQGDFCNGAGGTDTNVGTNNPNIDPYTYNPGGDPNDPRNIVLRDAQDTLKTLQARGYEVDASTGSVKTPNGTMSAEQIAASANGMSDAEKNALGIDSASASATASVKPGEFEGSSETGGGKKRGGGGGESAGAGFDMNAYMRSLMGNGGGRGVAGLSVRAGDDNIGVRESNIFEQVSRAYGTDKVLNRGP